MSVEIAKTMPFFHKLDIQDQVKIKQKRREMPILLFTIIFV
jgi:hypothetical protein